MPRALWEGSISFGLVEIPVSVFPAENREEMSFRMLDKRDFAPIGYQRINKTTGKEVPWESIVKGYEVEKDEYVVLSDEELKSANVKATQTIDIMGFVKEDEIDPMYFDRPYYVVPLKRGSKSYALLRDTLQRTNRVGIARVVLRTRQHLAALRPRGPLLVLELLRFAHELREPEDLELPVDSLGKTKASEAEVKLAERLVKEMAIPWKPAQYEDEFRKDVLALVQSKLKNGKARTIESPGRPKRRESGEKVLDLMALLKKSVKKVERPAARASKSTRQRKAG
jgi:DNA end-binding protein Ku